MPRLPDHEIIASLQEQVSRLRLQLRNTEKLLSISNKESTPKSILEIQIKLKLSAIERRDRYFDALRFIRYNAETMTKEAIVDACRAAMDY